VFRKWTRQSHERNSGIRLERKVRRSEGKNSGAYFKRLSRINEIQEYVWKEKGEDQKEEIRKIFGKMRQREKLNKRRWIL